MIRAPLDADDPHQSQRLALACKPLTGEVTNSRYLTGFTYEPLMGEWSRLAADHTETPEQLTSVKLNDMVVDYGLFAKIVTSNYRHFQPASVASWQEEHALALNAAVDAARIQGLDQIHQFEAALAIEAFAQHYLQDSFASGHMGFNRVASSNAAALTYHDAKSKSGRCVANQEGEVWYTYGDHYFDLKSIWGERVIAAAAASFQEVLTAFVRGTTDETKSETILYLIPAYIKKSATSRSGCAPGAGWEPLRTIDRPAESVSTIEVATVVDRSIYRPAPRSILIGLSHDYAFTIPIGDRVIQNRLFVAAGATVTEIGHRSYMAEYAYLWHVGTSLRGTLTHEIGFGQLFFYLPSSRAYYAYRNWSQHLLYAVNVEVGRVFVRGLIGPASSRGGSGIHASIGIGYVRQAHE